MSWHRPHAEVRAAGQTLLCTRSVAAALTSSHPEKIRRTCPPVACDVRTRAILVDATALDPQISALLADSVAT